MKDVIEQLRVLNQIDQQLRTLKKDLDRLPAELAVKEAVPRGLRAALERARAEVLRLKMEADAAELEVKSGEDALKRYAMQLNVIRTSKEFEATRRQMDAQRAWNKENETKALNLMEQLEATEKEIEKTRAALAAADEALAADAAEVKKTLAELSAQQKKLLAERARLAEEIPDKELATYNRIVNTHGTAIANVDRGICSACYMKIPPQIHNLALLAKDLVCCPSCGRILTANPS